MNIVTFSREFGSGGRELAKKVAEILGYDYYDREIITEIAQRHDVDENYVEYDSYQYELGRKVGIKMSFKEQGIDAQQWNDNIAKIALLAYEDQCSPANPKLPLVDDMMKILQDTYEAKQFASEYKEEM